MQKRKNPPMMMREVRVDITHQEKEQDLHMQGIERQYDAPEQIVSTDIHPDGKYSGHKRNS